MPNSQKLFPLPPSEEDIAQAKESSRILAKYADMDRVRMTLKGNEGQGDDLILPGPVVQLLLNVLSEVSQGNAVNIMPIHAELSTQEAANILNVSRPHLVKLLEQGEIDFHKVGTHRKVLAKNIIEYKERITKQRHEVLDELVSVSQEMGMGYD
ncbi:excisionase family DNA-binding protein [Leucothrix pacifica]|uniref:DNA-binding protein n=1 Tax=Leucothrix pacifica TaxID=1247513 RepID=A0A317CET9_9GAMM|nr:excisionase family DNA-binding protein [Leucothrix pacifica]PWQ96859.1 DNA-binding protein [Leucothrix pacifica]